MSLQDETGLLKGKVRTKDKARVKATAAQWEMTRSAIDAFAVKYPDVWRQFVIDTQRERDSSNPYAEGKNERGKKMPTEWRKTAVFPSAHIPNPEIPGDFEVDSLVQVLEGIIPGLCHKDSVNFVEFLKRFPVFSPSWRLNV